MRDSSKQILNPVNYIEEEENSDSYDWILINLC